MKGWWQATSGLHVFKEDKNSDFWQSCISYDPLPLQIQLGWNSWMETSHGLNETGPHVLYASKSGKWKKLLVLHVRISHHWTLQRLNNTIFTLLHQIFLSISSLIDILEKVNIEYDFKFNLKCMSYNI